MAQKLSSNVKPCAEFSPGIAKQSSIEDSYGNPRKADEAPPRSTSMGEMSPRCWIMLKLAHEQWERTVSELDMLTIADEKAANKNFSGGSERTIHPRQPPVIEIVSLQLKDWYDSSMAAGTQYRWIQVLLSPETYQNRWSRASKHWKRWDSKNWMFAKSSFQIVSLGALAIYLYRCIMNHCCLHDNTLDIHTYTILSSWIITFMHQKT